MKRTKRRGIHRLISAFLSVCMFMTLFTGIELKAEASVWHGGVMGDNGNSSGSVYITAVGSWYADRYTFRPTRTGVYRFYSSMRSAGDPYIQIADSYHWDCVENAINSNKCKAPGSHEFAANDDSNGDLNFLVYVFLEAGKNYYIFNTRYSNSDARYYTYWSYMGAGTVTLNKQGGSGGTSYLYGGRSGYSPSISSYDSWWTTSLSSTCTSSISIPTRAGYAFEGYYTGTNGTGTQIINSSGNFNSNTLKNTFSSNGTLYAKWRALYSTYTLNANGGSGGQTSVTVNQYSTLPALSSLPTKTGYDFTGYWSDQKAPNEAHNPDNIRYKADGTSTYQNTLAGQTIPLYAGWNAKTYSAILNANGGTGGMSVDVTYDAVLPRGIAAPVKTGYEFQGYYYNYGLSNQVQYYDSEMNPTTVNDAPRTWTHAMDGVQLVADWEPIQYNIQLFSNDDVYGIGSAGNKASGYVDTIEDVVYGDMVLPSAEELGLSREHYDFVGWNIYDEQDWAMFQPYTEYHTGLASVAGADAQLYAAWKMKDNYTISYSINGGTGNYPRNQTIFKGDALTVTNTIPTYTNHTFMGWYTTPNGEGSGPYYAGDVINNITENTTLYARWKEDKTLSYNANGGSFTTSFSTQYYPETETAVKVYLPGVTGAKGFESTTLTADDMPTRVGYNFKGWATSPTATTPDYEVGGTTTFSMEGITSNIILYAVWEIEEYDIAYTKDGLEGADSDLIVIENAAEKVEYNSDYTFTITLDERAVDASGLMVTVNDIAILNPTPTIDEQNANIKHYIYNIGSAISNQTVVISGVAKKEYNVVYNTNGGIFRAFNEDEQGVVRSYYFSENEGDKVTLPKNNGINNDISKTGYIFEGWYESSNLSGDAVTEFSKSDASDKTFYAKWTPITYTIKYNKTYDFAQINHADVFADQTDCEYDTTITLVNPTFNTEDSDIDCKIGLYKFDLLGWSTTRGSTVAEYNLGETVRNLATDNDGEVTLYAVWDIPSYKVSFDLDGGESEAIPTQVVTEGNRVTFPENPTRTGYEFAGWKVEGHTEESDPFVTEIAAIDKDYDLVAQWEANSYNVTYKIVVPIDGKLMTNDANPTEITAGTYTVDDVTYNVSESPSGTFTIKSDTAVKYDATYHISAMPFVMHSQYDDFLLDKADFESYMDEVALYYAWQAYDAIEAQWQEAIEGTGTGDGEEGTPAGWIDYGEASDAWDSHLATALTKLNCAENRIQDSDDAFTTYLKDKFAGYIAKPEASATGAPVEPGDLRPSGEPSAVNEPKIITEPSRRAATEFLGWNTDALSADVLYLAESERTNLCTGTENDNAITLYAIYGADSVNYLFYDTNGGIWPASGALPPQKADAGMNYATISSAKQPTKVGYTFGGWSLNGTGTPLNTVSLASNHATVKAIWTPETYKVYFKRNDTGSYTQTVPEYDIDGNVIGSVENYYSGQVGVLEDEVTPQNMTYGIASNLQDNIYTSTNNYEFLGWSVDEDAVRPEYADKQSVKNLPYTTDSITGEKSVTLYAIWQKKDAFIRFNANGGTGEPNSIFRTSDSQTVFDLPINCDAPAREGFTFKGWASSPNAEAPNYTAILTDGQITGYEQGNTITTSSKTVLYAVWEETPYCSVEYVKAEGVNGAVPVDTNRYYVGNEVTVDFSKLPEKPGYHFDGWKRNDETTYKMNDSEQVTFTIQAADFASGVTNNKITLTEQIAANTYNVKFYFRGNEIGAKTLTYGASEVPDMSGIMSELNASLGDEEQNYTFMGWSLVNGGKVSYTNTELKNLSVVNGGVVRLYAVMKAKEVTLTIHNQDGTEPATKQATYGELLPAITEMPTREGFTFGGYYTTENPQADDVPVYDATLNANGICMFNTDTELFAKWTPKTYRIVYIYDGTTLYTDILTYRENAADREVTVATSSIFPTGIIVSGATSLYGWSKSGQNNGEDVYRTGTNYKYDMWEIGEGNDIILYPIIVPDEKVTVTYNANGGSGLPVDNTEYQAGDPIHVLFNKIPTRDNYVFMGWSIDPNLDAAMLEEDNSGNFFKYEQGGMNDYSFIAQRNVTLYAIWKPGTYNITYKSNAEDATKLSEVSNVLTVEKGSTLSRHAGEIYTRPGYVLEGWSTSKNVNNAVIYDLDSTIDTILTTRDNIDLYTVWRAADVMVTFDTVGGNTVSAMNIAYNSNYGVLPAAEKEGYTFEGWYASYDEETGEYALPISPTTKVTNTERHVLYAKWAENTFTIQYHMNFDDDEIISQNYNVNQEVTLLNEDSFIREGHNLLGFSVSPNGPVVYQIGQLIGNGWASKGAVVHLYCVWDVETGVETEPTQSYIYYVSNGAANGLAPSYSIYTTGSTATIQDNVGNMSKYGYYFNGWNTEPDGTGTAYAPGDTLELGKSMILFADWKIGSYRLLLNKDQGVETITVSPEKELYTCGEEIAITVTLKDGFIWKGFVSGSEEDIPSSRGEQQEDGSFVYNFKMGGAVANITVTTNVNLKLDANGGTYEDNTTVKSYEWGNNTVLDTTMIETPSRENGYNFIGWFTDAECNHPWNEENLISESITLYAGWGYAVSTGEMSVFAIGNQTYTGSALKPEVVVKDGDKVLKAGVDYTVTYKNNKNVNKNGKYVTTNALVISEDSIDSQSVDKTLPYVIIKGKGNYSSTIQMNFNIYPKDLSNIDTDKELNLYYDQYIAASSNKELKPAIVLTYTPENGKQQNLKASKDYIVTYSGAAGNDLTAIPKGATGTYVMKVAAKEGGQYANSFTKEITIIEGASDLANAKITIKTATLTKDMTVDGLSIKVKMGKTTLKQGTDFTAEFVNGTPDAPGTYMVRIKPVEGTTYTGSATGKVVLKAAPLKKVQVNILTDAVYSGEDYGDGIVSLIDNGIELTKGVDYTTTYKGGINAGKVDVTIIGQGIYKGSSRKVSYKIEQYDLSVDLDKVVTVISPSEPAEYSNTGAVPNYTVLFGTEELVNGVDFKASYLNNTKLTSEYALNRPQIIIEGTGNFKGKINGGSFAIVQKNFTQDAMTVSATGITYKENSVLNVKFKLYEAGGKKALVAGKDYDKNHITYTYDGEVVTKCPPIGSEITVTVNGTGNYTGAYSFNVSVGGNTINKAKNLKVSKTYTGEEIKLTSEELGLTYKIANAAEADYFNRIGTYVKVGETEACTTLQAKDTIILTAGRDYDLENAVYTNNVKKGKASVTISGKGFFIGTKKISYQINNKSLKWWEQSN